MCPGKTCPLAYNILYIWQALYHILTISDIMYTVYGPIRREDCDGSLLRQVSKQARDLYPPGYHHEERQACDIGHVPLLRDKGIPDRRQPLRYLVSNP